MVYLFLFPISNIFSFLFQYPHHGFGDSLGDHILLYRHDLRSINILQLITVASEITDGTLVEVVISCEYDFIVILLF